MYIVGEPGTGSVIMEASKVREIGNNKPMLVKLAQVATAVHGQQRWLFPEQRSSPRLCWGDKWRCVKTEVELVTKSVCIHRNLIIIVTCFKSTSLAVVPGLLSNSVIPHSTKVRRNPSVWWTSFNLPISNHQTTALRVEVIMQKYEPIPEQQE